ncbi:MAG TPA: metal-dependent hydrolase [Blastocatellia bacterium]|nr:metal-dependent hydrolase [Blastocatellia bacterium]
MPTPVAHGLMGAMVVAALGPRGAPRRNWKILLIGCGLGAAPDLDVILNLLRVGDANWHHDFTHSIAFALLAGLAAAAMLMKEPGWKAALIFGAATATHPLLDFIFTSSDGVELLWPLSADRFALGSQGFGIYGLRHDSLTHGAEDLLKTIVAELLLYGSMLAAVLLSRGRPARTQSFIAQE